MMQKTELNRDMGLTLAEMEAFSVIAFGHTGGVNYDFQKMLKHVKTLRDAVRAECPDYGSIADFKV